MQIRSYGLSDIGKRRIINEDSFLIDDELGFFVVADGVGGRAKGEIASALAVEEAYGFLKRGRNILNAFVKHPSEENHYAVKRLMESSVQSACYMVFSSAEQDPESHGMSTTMSALLLLPNLGIVAQVGDSRVYRLRAGEVVQLTEDHTLINYKLKHGLITPEEAEHAPGKNVITRAVGHRDYVQVDTLLCDIADGDRFLLCSDGLHNCLDEDEIANILTGESLEFTAARFIDLANQRGGRDNITVVLAEIF